MSFISNFKKLTGASRGKLPVYYLNLYFKELFSPLEVSILQKLEIRKLYSSIVQDDDVLLFLLLLSDSPVTPEKEVSLELEKFGVNYWPVLPVEPVNPIDILYKPHVKEEKEDILSEKSMDSGYESMFENDVYSVSCKKVLDSIKK